MDRRERIDFLLTHLEDVREGVRDLPSGGGENIPLMCRAWNSPAYQEIERLLPHLRAEHPRLATHLLDRYFSPRRQVKACPRCDSTVPAWSSVNFHRHAGKNVAVVPRVLRMTSPNLRPELVTLAIAWLDKRWRGDLGVFIPDELLPLVSVA